MSAAPVAIEARWGRTVGFIHTQAQERDEWDICRAVGTLTRSTGERFVLRPTCIGHRTQREKAAEVPERRADGRFSVHSSPVRPCGHDLAWLDARDRTHGLQAGHGVSWGSAASYDFTVDSFFVVEGLGFPRQPGLALRMAKERVRPVL